MRRRKWFGLSALLLPALLQASQATQSSPSAKFAAARLGSLGPIVRTPSQGPLTLRGVVVDGTGRPRAGIPLVARVNGLEWSSVSGPDGTYDFFLGYGWTAPLTAGPDWRLVPRAKPDGTVDLLAFRNLYVGSDDEKGAPKAAFATPQAVVNALQPGDTVYLKPGVYQPPSGGENRRVLKLVKVCGTPDAPITITAYDPDHPPMFDGAVGSGALTAVELIDCAWVNISYLEIRGFKFAGIDVLNGPTPGTCRNIIVEYCHVHDKHPNNTGWGYAIRLKGPGQHVTFRKNYVHRWSAGIALWENPEQNANSCFVPPKKGNSAPGSPAGGYTADLPEDEWNAWEGWTQIAPRWCVIEDNLCHNNTSTKGPQNADNFVTRYSIDCVVRNNIGFNDWSGQSEVIDDNFDMTGATRMRFHGNIAFHCTYLPPYPSVTGSGNGMKIGVRGALDPIAHHNISFYNYRMGLDMGYSVRPKVYNNTIYYHSSAPQGHHKGGDYGLFFEGKSTKAGVDCVNNVIKDCRQPDIGAQHWVKLDRMDYNCISDAGTANYACAQGAHSRLSADPLFSNEGYQIDSTFPPNWTIEQKLEHIRSQIRQRFTPRAGSPCIDAGVAVPGITDGYRGAAPDMGAIETP